MKSITMTQEQTRRYDGSDSEARDVMRDMQQRAQQLADASGETVEIYTADGIVADTRTPAR